MQRITYLSLALLTGICFHTQPLFAQDQGPDQKDKKDVKGSPHADKGTPKVSKSIEQGTQEKATSGGEKAFSQPDSGKSYGRSDSNKAFSQAASGTEGAYQAKSAVKQSSKAINQSVQQVTRGPSQQQQAPAFVVQGNPGNHYDGKWVSGSSHSDWDQSTDHNWNHHDYRWYDGGWLIIDTGPSPDLVVTSSIGSSVQASLAQQGYYNGPVDGYIGRGTRRAISHYESDNGLPVNGEIDGPLLVSLRLE